MEPLNSRTNGVHHNMRINMQTKANAKPATKTEKPGGFAKRLSNRFKRVAAKVRACYKPQHVKSILDC